eukprot:Pompholyxophrys_punicea_v1_NODE_1467_length_702_cov_2.275116.p1 type:complete len:157 gc:universal NODE_1467_length_702_cov_2.275116:585-115(-)
MCLSTSIIYLPCCFRDAHANNFVGDGPSKCRSDSNILMRTIVDFLVSFSELYGTGKIIPKFHYYLHLPDTLLRFGPLWIVACMRFEAKHQQSKLAGTLSNWKNVPLSIMNAFCLQICEQFLKTPGLPHNDPWLNATTTGPSKLADVQFSEISIVTH